MVHDGSGRTTMRLPTGATLLLLGPLLLVPPALAVTGLDSDVPRTAPEGPADDYAAGLAAHQRGDWQAVIDHMAKVIELRPWDAEAYNLAGHAYRKLGDYERALALYDKALNLNPHHRGALEYLGEAYLELERPEDARALLERLATECRRIALPGQDWRADCEEWQDLKTAYDAYRAGQPRAASTE
jgi:tetratricopeptide (TPR) repeat protein